MSPAEFRTTREALGLTAQWVANFARVSLRTAQYWEEGRRVVPSSVEDALEAIDQALEASITQALEQVDALIDSGNGPDEIVLIRYRTDEDLWAFRPDMRPLPASTHAAMLARLRRALRARGVTTFIEFMKPEEYRRWLGARPDTEDARAEWAATAKEPPLYPVRRESKVPAERERARPWVNEEN
ncbi:DUF1870 family protein [Haematospirillum jordaniae]|nr:DUF1870 family protein [Haematospirillum jordaniae]